MERIGWDNAHLLLCWLQWLQWLLHYSIASISSLLASERNIQVDGLSSSSSSSLQSNRCRQPIAGRVNREVKVLQSREHLTTYTPTFFYALVNDVVHCFSMECEQNYVHVLAFHSSRSAYSLSQRVTRSQVSKCWERCSSTYEPSVNLANLREHMTLCRLYIHRTPQTMCTVYGTRYRVACTVVLLRSWEVRQYHTR